MLHVSVQNISTLSIATSSLVTIVVLALGVALLVPLQPVLQSPVLQPAFANVVPALFGAMAYQYFRKNIRVAIAPLVMMSVLFMLVPSLTGSTSFMIVPSGALAIGIGIQNFPEGAIISMPLRSEGMNKGKAFLGGMLSGIVEPIGAVLTILAASLIVPALPYFLSYAAGAMLYVVVEELIPEMSEGEHSDIGTIFFAVGFSVMMVLDVALG